ncbi:helix-turn-helix transcriptional regulator [Flavisolibacter sp. BT320]|nr:helix-turn-helix transcriptional regulator [Flavisolibacter longurius]
MRRKPLRNDDFCRAFGAHLRKLREKKGVSMRQFAADIDLEYNQLYLIETGKVNTSISMAHAIAEGLGVPVHDLFTFRYATPGKKG